VVHRHQFGAELHHPALVQCSAAFGCAGNGKESIVTTVTDQIEAWPECKHFDPPHWRMSGLEARLRTADAVLRVFARIEPSTLHAPDGRERERYSVVLANQVQESGDFDGGHLADARAYLAAREGER
jgi:hypothetical protein